MKKRSIMAMMLAGVLAASMLLTACGGAAPAEKAEEKAEEAVEEEAEAAEEAAEEPAAEEAAEEPAAEEPAAEEEAAEEPAAEGVNTEISGELEVCLFRGGYQELWDEMIKLFNEKYPNVTVTADISEDLATRVRARMMTDDQPDLVMLSDAVDYNYWEGAKAGMLRDLSDFFENGVNADGDPMSEVYDESLKSGGTVDGKLVLPAWGTGYGCWYYNKALFDEHGWTAPATWDEFIALCADIKEAGIDPFICQGAGAIGYLDWGFFYEAVAAAGGFQAYEDACLNYVPGAWDSPAVLDAAQKLAQLSEEGFLDKDTLGMEFPQTQIEFVNDRAAFIPNGSWLENEMADSTPEGFEMTFMPIPIKDADGNRYVTALDSTLFVPAGAKNYECIEAFLGVFYSKEGQRLVMENGALPVSSLVTADDLGELTSCQKSIIEGAAAGNLKFTSNRFEELSPTMRQPLADNFIDLLLGDITPEEFCSNMEAAAEDYRNDDSITKFY